MKQAIAGVSPSSEAETTSMTTWPSNAATSIGRLLGGLYEINLGFSVFTMGNLMVLISAPIGALLFVSNFLPFIGVRYRITNRRIMVERGLNGNTESWIDLDKFDSIEVKQLPGQAWYHAGDLIFFKGKTECFHLRGVSRPEAFRAACIKAHMTYVGIKEAKEREARLK